MFRRGSLVSLCQYFEVFYGLFSDTLGENLNFLLNILKSFHETFPLLMRGIYEHDVL